MKFDLMHNFSIPDHKIIVIPNPVDTDQLKKLAAEDNKPFGNNFINLLSVGSLTQQKGFDILINAMEYVVSERTDILLTILGEGHLKDDLQQRIDRRNLNNHVVLAGFKNNPFPYIYKADRFILSSRYEGLPNVVLEAIALGTPVIAFDSPGCIRDINRTTSSVTLVSPFEASTLAKAILKSCRKIVNPYEIRLAKKFSKNSVVRSYEALFLNK
jgi:glycosyltransferase involved in cell wall biosynthesis